MRSDSELLPENTSTSIIAKTESRRSLFQASRSNSLDQGMEHDVRALVKKGAKEEESDWSEEDENCWSNELAELEDGGGYWDSSTPATFLSRSVVTDLGESVRYAGKVSELDSLHSGSTLERCSLWMVCHEIRAKLSFNFALHYIDFFFLLSTSRRVI